MPNDGPYNEALLLLQRLINTPSFSREESGTANLLENFFKEKNIAVNRQGNNIWCTNKYFDISKKSLLLNSHHDTVKPNSGYTRDPFFAALEDGKLFGLGSNDAGGPLVSLIACYLNFYDKKNLPVNIVLAATAEEEISGSGGIESILSLLPQLEAAIVGEPTGMQVAIAEKGLMVLDCEANGIAGHAAREEGENAIYKAMKDIEWFSTYRFEKVSTLLGPVKMTVTSINTSNTAHNVVPADCKFVVDLRINELYKLDEILTIIRKHVSCTVRERSTRLGSSHIDKSHPLVMASSALGKELYGSPTLSDQALLSIPSIKCGPGESARSHTADEFIYLEEIKTGIQNYIQLVDEYARIINQSIS